MRGPRISGMGVLLLGVVVTLLAYRPALEAGFFFDDRQNIEQASGVRWTAVSLEALRGLRDSTLIPRRVVANTTFALNHLVGGLDPWGYHLTNVLLHLAVGLALAWVAWLYVREVRPDEAPDTVALAVAVPVVVFLVHPLNTQAVTYVVQRMASLVALFSLLAFGMYLVGRRRRLRDAWPWYLGALGSWVLALGTKENAVLLPLVLGTYEGCVHRHAWRRWWGALRPDRRTLVVVAAGGVAVALVALVLAYAGSRPIAFTRAWPQRDFTGIERVLTQFRVQVLYLGLLLWPAPGRLNLDHDISVSRGLFDPPSTLVAGLFWLGVIAGVLVLAARRPRYGFPVLAYLLWHTVEAGPVNLELVFEHRMYLPMTMLVLLGAVALVDLRGRWRHPLLIAAALLVLPLAWGTWQRNLLWADAEAFYWDTARKSPGKPRPWYNLGTLLLRWDRPDEAVEPLEHAAEVNPTDWRTADQLGMAYLGAGQTDAALATFRRALALKPDEFEPALHIGTALELKGSTQEASRHLLRVGTERGMAGDVMMAMLALQRAVSLDSASSRARNALGNAYLLAGRSDDALVQYREAVRLDPSNVEALYNVGMLLAELRERDEAIDFLERFIGAAPARLAAHVAAVREKVRSLRGES